MRLVDVLRLMFNGAIAADDVLSLAS